MIRLDTPVVVFLANDAILHWALPFLESLRTTNPETRLLLIPFDDATERLRSLAATYRFDIMDYDFTEIGHFGAIAFPRGGRMVGRLRKLALFDIAAPAVVYLDTDTIVTADLSPLLRRLAATAGQGLVYASESPGWAYRAGAVLPPRLVPGPQFSSGFLGLSGPPIGAAAILRVVRENLVDYLIVRAADVVDQPVVNLAIDLLGVAVTRLDAAGSFSARNWVRDARIVERAGVLRDEAELPVAFLHWAGQGRASPQTPHWDRFEAARAAAERRVGPQPV